MAPTRARLRQVATSRLRITSSARPATRLYIQKSPQEVLRSVANLTHLYFIPQILATPTPGFGGRGECPCGIKTP